MPDDPGPAADTLEAPRLSPDIAPAAPPPCRITFHGCAASEPPRVEVRAWLARLGALTGPMLGGDVAIEAVDEARKERCYRVRIQLQMPAGPVLVGSDHPANLPCDDVYVAIRNAFRIARRELETQLRGNTPGAV
ncbi:MAG: HPF/RaiA family ribosome-associated protein [Polyangia bacterium]